MKKLRKKRKIMRFPMLIVWTGVPTCYWEGGFMGLGIDFSSESRTPEREGWKRDRVRGVHRIGYLSTGLPIRNTISEQSLLSSLKYRDAQQSSQGAPLTVAYNYLPKCQ